MNNQWLLAIAIAIAIIVVLLVVDLFRTQMRTRQMRAGAARLGYEFVAEDAGLVAALGEFALFARGGLSRKTTNLLRAAVDGIAVTIFDYRYIVGLGKRKQTHRQSVLLLESDRLELPLFALRPERLGEKLQGLRGRQDIDLDDQPRFSSTYILQGPDESQIRALFSGEKPAFFARQPGLYVEGSGRRLLYYRARKRVSPGAIPSFVEEGLAVLHLLAGDGVPASAGEADSLAGPDERPAPIGPLSPQERSGA